MKKKIVSVLMCLTLAAALMIGGCSDSESTSGSQEETSEAAEPSSEATDADYLQVYFDVDFSGEDPDAAAFNEALVKVAGEEAPQVSEELTLLSAINAAVNAADYEELALSYPEDKISERLEHYGISEDVEDAYNASLACALDVSLVDEDMAKKAADGETLTADDAVTLLMNVVTANGDGRNYLGMASDPDIYAKLDQAWNSFVLFDDEVLTEIGKDSVQQQVTTGYGIKSAYYSARFLPDLTIQYGHSDITHAHQLIGLLNSEDIDAKVQLEPKISIYEYLLEWGEPGEPTETYAVTKYDDDLYLASAVEYDLELEFNTTEDMDRFDEIIREYAKKYEGNEDAVGLIYGSWWQPLYSTTRTDMDPEQYVILYDCVVTNGTYSIHPFTLEEDLDNTLEKLTEFAGDADVEITPVARYANLAFHNYLTGDDYQ